MQLVLLAGLVLASACLGSACADDAGNGNTMNLDPSVLHDAGGLADAALGVPGADGGPLAPGADGGPGGALDAGRGPADGGALPGVDGQVVTPAGDGGLSPDGGAGDPRMIGLAGSGLSVFPTNGMPLEVQDGSWIYVEFPETSCRSGGKAGVTLWRNHQSKKLMFFFEGGGACFDDLTCVANPDSIGDPSKSPSGGILDKARMENPAKDWNVVYVPYCTGDVFGGTNPDGNISGQPQKFVGYLNTKAFLQRLVPTFSDATDVLVTGVSAGGFGASMSASLIQRAFPWVKAKVIDDSGPPMPSSVLATCLQKKWRETWGFDQSVLVDCGANCPNKDDFTMDLGLFLAKTFSNRLSGLIEAQEDFVISGFFGAGLDDCTGIPLLTGIPADQFHAGLLAFREAAKSYPNFGTYYPPGSDHTWLMGDTFYTSSVDGTSLLSWVSDIINDKGTKQVGQ